jgi:hypothetical protein
LLTILRFPLEHNGKGKQKIVFGNIKEYTRARNNYCFFFCPLKHYFIFPFCEMIFLVLLEWNKPQFIHPTLSTFEIYHIMLFNVICETKSITYR